MRIIALVIGVILVSGSVVAGIDNPSQGNPLAGPELQDGQAYTGVIKNKTRYEVSVPSENSDATLVIPANSWIEYTTWTHHSDVTAYRDGKPFYCLKIDARPKNYDFMCKKYDFITEIVKPEASRRDGPSKLKHRKIKRKVKNPPC